MGALGLSDLILLILFVFSVNVCAKKNHVPVLIWGPGYDVSKESFPVFKDVSSDEFFNHFLKNVHKEDDKPAVVLFIEKTFSIEDFSSQIDKYETVFQSLEDLTSKDNLEFLLSVENPVTTLTKSDLTAYGFSLSNKEFDTNSLKKGVIYTVNLEDADPKEDRPEMLQRHDEKIASIYKRLAKNNKNFVAILTGHYSSWTEPDEVIRVRRQTNETSNNDSKPLQPIKPSVGVVLQAKTALIYSRAPLVLKIGEKEVNLNSQTSDLSDEREKYQRAIFTYNTELGQVKLRFRFENTSSNYWSLSQVELVGPVNDQVLLSTKRYIGAQYDHSFHTSSPVVFKNGTMSLTFSNMQVQPWKSASERNTKFGEADDDTSFFTPGIWTGLIVTGLLGLILIWALVMIMDIRTMDQFDDPKGKTITVNVTD